MWSQEVAGVAGGSRVTEGHNSLDTISALALIVEAVDLVN